uniref:Uncharacterized protein n=1 Tax=Rhodnius prolixus TaxID=13249 RepID=T1I969_RHOPR
MGMDGGFKLKELKNIGRPLRLDDLKKERSQKILAAIDRKKPLQLIVAVRNARVSGNAGNIVNPGGKLGVFCANQHPKESP